MKVNADPKIIFSKKHKNPLKQPEKSFMRIRSCLKPHHGLMRYLRVIVLKILPVIVFETFNLFFFFVLSCSPEKMEKWAADLPLPS